MNNTRAIIMFITTISVTFFIFTLFTAMSLNMLLIKKFSVKFTFGSAAAVLLLFYLFMYLGRGLDIKFFWNLGFYMAVIIMYLLFLSLILKLINLGFPMGQKTNIIIMITVISAVFVYGYMNASGLGLKTIRLMSSKISKPYTFVQISDVHLGTESLEFLDRIIEEINKIAPDAVFITGDFIDDHKLDPEDLKSLSGMNAPAYFITGNHERYSEYSDDFFKNCGKVTVLDHFRRQVTFNDEVDIFGIEWNRRDILNRRSEQKVFFDSIKTDDSKFNIFLNHEPKLYDLAEKHGMDLMLSGHTHRGQIFPFWLFVRMRYKYIYGLNEIGKLKLYVTSGTGVWGPFLRVGSSNEIVVIKIDPEK